MKLYATHVVAGITALMLAGAVQQVQAQSNAHYTQVRAPWGPNETHADILGHIYGGTFTVQGNGRDFSNGAGIYVERIADWRDGGSAAVGSADQDNWTDELWASVFDFASAKARYAAKEQSFGVLSGQSGGARTEIFALEGDRDQVAGEGEVSGTGDGLFRWYRGPDDIYTSRIQDNLDKLDHMVTYMVHFVGEDRTRASVAVQPDSVPTFLLFWEDLQVGNHVDYDFNDLVVEVLGTRQVPEPGSLVALGAVGAGMLLKRRRR